MHSFVTAAGFALGASAAILPRNDGCCFQLTASGGQSGTLGQLDDGQNRIGGGLGSAQYCINNGMITDGSGRGCILTPPTTQFQCDMGASPDGGFSVNSNGMLEHSGDSTFYACPADQGEYNIYTQPVDNQPKCVEVSLSTGGKCAAAQSMTSQQTCPPAQTVYKTKTEQGKASTIYQTETEQAKPTTVYKTETVQNTQYKPTTVYQTKTEEETETKPVTAYKTKVEEETKTVPTTVYETKTQQTTVTAETPTTVYKTSTVMETKTVPTTAYETKTQQTTVTAETPTTVYKTEYKTETKPVTQYDTKTVQNTVTAETPTTVYKTEEKTEYKPTTAYETKTVQQTVTAKQPTTVYNTKTVEETETAKAQTVTKVQTQYETKQAQTVTKTECNYEGHGKPTWGGNGWGHGKPTGKPSPTQQSSACPTDLNSGAYETPHLIVPVNSEHPDQSYGTSYNGKMSSSESSIFNFDIPQSYEGKTCSLVFMLPKKADLETSDYTMKGSGSISVDQLSSPAKESTSWNSAPEVASHAGSFSPQAGNSYVVSTGDCAAGTTQSYELSASDGLSLEYFQDYNPSPIGLYITTC